MLSYFRPRETNPQGGMTDVLLWFRLRLHLGDPLPHFRPWLLIFKSLKEYFLPAEPRRAVFLEYKKNLRHPLFKPEISNPTLRSKTAILFSLIPSLKISILKKEERREESEKNKRSGNFLSKIAASFEDSDQLSYQTHTLMTFCWKVQETVKMCNTGRV